ncbi:5-methyltetrahydropteroyltriglutamate--homocysteine S-methyltransferase [bacterium]|nr:MAG: 5-methyltetrahydropteroyltriglutamate--homocysteine S-methyltransferase [bacterium]
MALATNLGFPRIGPKRELKKAVESYWAGRINREELMNTAAEIRQGNWKLQQESGLDYVPCGDFSYYDHMLDTIAMAGAVPERYGWTGGEVDLETYFAMARGIQSKGKDGLDAPAMEMTKWFDTNYHYIVPEFSSKTKFKLSSTKVIDEFKEAASLGIKARPVLVGPVTFLLLGKAHADDVTPPALLDDLLEVYVEVLKLLRDAGAEWVQLDEPCLVLDLTKEAHAAYRTAYEKLTKAVPGLKILLATYFDELRENIKLAFSLPVAAVHLDLVRAPQQLDAALKTIPRKMSLSVGVVDGRNVWKTEFDRVINTVHTAADVLGNERVMVAPSCSMLHSPVDLNAEQKMDGEIKQWLAFATQKVSEIAVITKAVNKGEVAVAEELKANREACANRKTSRKIHNDATKKRSAAVTDAMMSRKSPFAARRKVQQEALQLPVFPTTTIGSFPQTPEIRAIRADFKNGKKSLDEYNAAMKKEIEYAIRFQEEIGIDVLVHGEAERTDMVEYFGEQLKGFVFTTFGWVQSYGSRCVRPPIIFGDVFREKPMTVEWATYAQSLTKLPVKGMLTGPVTILQWSFVRDDQPRSETCRQIGLAIRDEVVDLEAAGIQVIQIDEPAIREGLPLRKDRWNEYLEWAVNCFRLSASGVRDETQIHTHMCYSEFNDMIEAIGRMDADVISMETSRSQMELLQAFRDYKYPNEIGPGVYDIHSPRVPSEEEMERLLRKACEVISADQLWVNPDCGLKTRRWEEVKPSLQRMVSAAKKLRAKG